MNISALLKGNNPLLIVFLLLKITLQYTLIHPVYELQRDEFLHLDQANHLAWGYLSVPPVTSWIAWLIQSLGNHEFWVRFFPGLFGVLTIVVVWKAIEALSGNRYALILGASCVVFSALLRLNLLFQPNAVDVFAWTITYYGLLKYLITRSSKWLYFTAVLFAFGFLNKYNILFLAIGLLPALLLAKEHQLFRLRSFYLALAIALLIVTPNLLWQYQHNFPVLHHMQALVTTHLVHVSRINFLQDQVLYFLGGLPVLLAAIYAFVFYPPLRPFRVFLYALAFTLAVFMYCRAKGYYAIGIYPIYFAFGATFLGNYIQNRSIKFVLVLLPILFIGLVATYLFPIMPPSYISKNASTYQQMGLLRWEDGQNHTIPQDFADMLGWKELAQKTDEVYLKIGSPTETLIICDNYGQAGAINFYSKASIKAVSFNADYINWFDLDQQYKHLIWIKERNKGTTELHKTSPYFAESYLYDSITNGYAREVGTSIVVFKSAQININEVLEYELAERKKSF